MSGVRITSGVAQSATSRITTAQDSIAACRTGGPTEVDAGDVADIVNSALMELTSRVDQLSSDMDGFSTTLTSAVSGMEGTDQNVASSTPKATLEDAR
ncbi:hypothetical protein [Actinomyces gerencseriae]|uniref:hypothetical protein n=1 Tax=Actinomyces gerencseriae TaxID=52769 RepID=UPI000418A94B|nr:hypothetical protein [Actinomyces gerencseriae]